MMTTISIGLNVSIDGVNIINHTERTTMAALDDLEREVRENSDALDSATALIQGLKAKLDEAIATGSMAKVQALAQQLSGQTDKLAQAITANTPAAESGGQQSSGGTEGSTSGGDQTGVPA